MKLKYKHLQIIKHALQHYVERPNVCKSDLVQERNLLDKVTVRVNELKSEYGIK